ncbi:MAG: carboxymuconolactone decarboxylase family protein [Dysgonamonadaceae bacterium]|nr:carboxymuconolactone decarboxylase family protein [Dysgonamonadaceae bacterium]
MKNKNKEFLEETLQRIGSYGEANPELMEAFSNVHRIGTQSGALSTKHKALIALGISISVKCDGCIAMHTTEALQNDASTDELVETIGTAIYMGGGPSVVFGAKAYEMLKEFDKNK